jgi:hypothetical protein
MKRETDLELSCLVLDRLLVNLKLLGDLRAWLSGEDFLQFEVFLLLLLQHHLRACVCVCVRVCVCVLGGGGGGG